ncbi:MAG: NUDIX hydrolase [Firmicutes bacterium]|nr:NUDIX hydrolase [Bacillota bacterium]
MDQKLKEKTVASQEVFQGRIIKVRVDTVLLPDGEKATREVVEHPGAVAVVPVTDRNEVIMVRQFRQPTGEILLELPAGKRDQQEPLLACAQRELEEETGCRAQEWKVLFSFFTTPGFSNELLTLLLARGLEKGEARPEGEEFLEVVSVPLSRAREMIFQGEIKDAKTIIGILALSFLEEEKGAF